MRAVYSVGCSYEISSGNWRNEHRWPGQAVVYRAYVAVDAERCLLAIHPLFFSFSPPRSINPTLPSQIPTPPIVAGARAIAAIHQAKALTGSRGG